MRRQHRAGKRRELPGRIYASAPSSANTALPLALFYLPQNCLNCIFLKLSIKHWTKLRFSITMWLLIAHHYVLLRRELQASIALFFKSYDVQASDQLKFTRFHIRKMFNSNPRTEIKQCHVRTEKRWSLSVKTLRIHHFCSFNLFCASPFSLFSCRKHCISSSEVTKFFFKQNLDDKICCFIFQNFPVYAPYCLKRTEVLLCGWAALLVKVTPDL